MNEKSPKLIEVLGLPGSGKTTIAKSLSNKLSYTYFDLDLFQANPFFIDYPSNPEKYAFIVGLYFSYHRTQQIQRLSKDLKKNNIVLDQGFNIGLYMYSHSAYINKKMTKKEWLFLQELHKYFIGKDNLPHIDVTIFIEEPIDVLVSRITDRGRKHEVTYQKKYLSNLLKSYNQYKQNLIKSKSRKTIISYSSTTKTISCIGNEISNLEKILIEGNHL